MLSLFAKALSVPPPLQCAGRPWHGARGKHLFIWNFICHESRPVCASNPETLVQDSLFLMQGTIQQQDPCGSIGNTHQIPVEYRKMCNGKWPLKMCHIYMICVNFLFYHLNWDGHQERRGVGVANGTQSAVAWGAFRGELQPGWGMLLIKPYP